MLGKVVYDIGFVEELIEIDEMDDGQIGSSEQEEFEKLGGFGGGILLLLKLVFWNFIINRIKDCKYILVLKDELKFLLVIIIVKKQFENSYIIIRFVLKDL